MCFYCERNTKGNPQYWWYVNFVCWTCRVQNGVKKPCQINSENNKGGRICYKCNVHMTDVGFKFKTPKKKDIKQWKLLEKTWENQYITINKKKIYTGPQTKIVEQRF